MMASNRGRTGSLDVLHFLLGVFLVCPEGGVCLELLPSYPEVLLNSSTNFTVVCSGLSLVTWRLPDSSLMDGVVVEDRGFSTLLQLTNTMWKNSGRYTCEEISSKQSSEIDIFIPGQGPEEWFIPLGSQKVNKEEGTIPCVVSDPRLNISLYELPSRTLVDETKYEPGRGFTGRLDDTSYVCLATRGDEQKESQVYYVFSIVDSELDLDLMVSSSVLKQGEPLTVTCTIKGSELVYFSWIIPHRQEIEPLSDVSQHSQISSIISISMATVADSGVYVCTVHDGVKDVMAVRNVTVTVLGLRAEGRHNSTGSQCETTTKADIVLLVSGLWRISSSTFLDIKNFLKRVVDTFDIGPDRVQIGLVQYSDDIWTEWHLNTLQTELALLTAIARLRQEEGGTMTGNALNYILQNILKPPAGMRADSKKIVVLITDGVSHDDVLLPSQNLKDAGIKVYAVGLHPAVKSELRSIASHPKDIHMYSVSDFPFFQDIFNSLIIILCNSLEPDDVRLVGGASRCAGTLEVKRGYWRPVHGSNWTLDSAAVACRELDCGSAGSIRRREESSIRPVWEISSDCVQSGSALRECVTSGSSSSILEITCSDPAVFIIRLVLLLLTLLLFITIIYRVHKASRGQRPGPQDNMELDYYNLGVGRAEEEGVQAAE